jgi:hypothetical protein
VQPIGAIAGRDRALRTSAWRQTDLTRQVSNAWVSMRRFISVFAPVRAAVSVSQVRSISHHRAGTARHPDRDPAGPVVELVEPGRADHALARQPDNGDLAVVTLVAMPTAIGIFSHPTWLPWGIAVGVCSSVVPYVTDQLAMARLPRAAFALMLALLPMFATLIGALALRQTPTVRDLVSILLVVAGFATHLSPPPRATAHTREIDQAVPQPSQHDRIRFENGI